VTACHVNKCVNAACPVPGDGYEARWIRYGPPTQRTLANETEEAVSICERLEKLNPVLGSVRIDDAEAIVRAQTLIAELVAGKAAETILRPDCSSPGAQHGFTEARACDAKDVDPMGRRAVRR
jgi:hypothetical protein